jgi:hypothetical protein
METSFSSLWCIEYLNEDGEWIVHEDNDDPTRPLAYFSRDAAREQLAAYKVNSLDTTKWMIRKVAYPA